MVQAQGAEWPTFPFSCFSMYTLSEAFSDNSLAACPLFLLASLKCLFDPLHPPSSISSLYNDPTHLHVHSDARFLSLWTFAVLLPYQSVYFVLYELKFLQ